MKLEKVFLLFGIVFVICGNTFAYSPYVNTIKQNIPKKSFLSIASFPQTAADASFVERVENKTEGYKPYFNRSAFSGMSIEEQDELESMAYRADVERLWILRNRPIETYCKRYPYDTENCDGVDVSSVEYVQPNIEYTPEINVNVPYMSAALSAENIGKYNLKTHNGGCTPPERSDWWRNDIQTTGQYANSEAAFEKFMITAFRKEGACGSHPNDRGGYTCYGCASNGLCAGVDFATITRAKVEDLAYSKIYKQYNIDKLPDAFRGYAMWGIWGSGPVTGIHLFQDALGVPRSNKIDDTTIRAAESYVGDFADVYTRGREKFFYDIVNRDPSQKVFLNGWLNGLKLLKPSGCHVVPNNPIYR